MTNETVRIVRLIVDALPVIALPTRYVLAGETAANLVHLDFPRGVRGIDLVPLDDKSDDKDAAFGIGTQAEILAEKFRSTGIRCEVRHGSPDFSTVLQIERDDVYCSIELNQPNRGTILPPVSHPLSAAAQAAFGSALSAPSLAVNELLGQLLVTALDRQYPQDWVDSFALYNRYGLPREAVDCFAVYLACQPRPIADVLFSKDRDLELLYETELNGLELKATPLSTVDEIRRFFRQRILEELDGNHRRFLLGMATGDVPWDAVPFPALQTLPAVRRKILRLSAEAKIRGPRLERRAAILAKRLMS